MGIISRKEKRFVPSSVSAFSLLELSFSLTIVALLIAAIMNIEKLAYSARLNSSRVVTFFSPVPKIKGLRLWLESTSQKSFKQTQVIDSTVVDTWYDSNPQVAMVNRLNATASGSARPTYIASAINGLPALRFDGSATCMTASATGFYASFLTVFVVAQLDPSNASQGVMLEGCCGSNSATFEVLNPTGNRGMFVMFDSPGGQPYSTSYTTSETSSTPHIFNGFYNSLISNVVYYYVDGGNFQSRSCVGGTGTCLTSVTLATFSVGCSYFSSTSYFGNYIGEIIVYDRILSDSEVALVKTYLSKKWRISVT